MWITMLGLFVIQIPAFMANCGFQKDLNDKCEPAQEHWFALFGLIYAIIGFIAYLLFQYRESIQGTNVNVDGHLLKVTKKAIESGDKSLVQILKEHYKDEFLPGGRLATSRKVGTLPSHLKKLLQNFFKRYDTDKDHRLDLSELGTLMKEILPTEVWNKPCRQDKIHELMGYLDTDENGLVSMDEWLAKAPEFIVRRFDTEGDNRVDESKVEKSLHLAQRSRSTL